MAQLTCPNCSTTFAVDESLFPDDGRLVRCIKCQHVWKGVPTPDPVEMAWEPEPEPEDYKFAFDEEDAGEPRRLDLDDEEDADGSPYIRTIEGEDDGDYGADRAVEAAEPGVEQAEEAALSEAALSEPAVQPRAPLLGPAAAPLALGLLLFICLGGAIAFRDGLVDRVPRLRPTFEALGLSLPEAPQLKVTGLDVRREAAPDNKTDQIVVRGELENLKEGAAEMPYLALQLLGPRGPIETIQFQPEGRLIKGNSKVAFEVRHTIGRQTPAVAIAVGRADLAAVPY